MMRKRLLILTEIAALFFLTACAVTSRGIKPERKVDRFKLKARDYFLEGVYLEQAEQYNQALVRFYQALHHDSTSATIYVAIAENHLKLGHYESAQILLKRALALDPDNYQALKLMGECEYLIGHPLKAAQYYKKLLSLYPDDEEALNTLSVLYRTLGKEEELIKLQEQRIKKLGFDPALARQLIIFYLGKKDFTSALTYARQLVKNDSTDEHYLYLLAEIYSNMDKADSALFYYQKAWHANPLYPPVLDRLSTWYRRLRRWDDIITLFQPLLTVDSTNKAARVLTGEAYFFSGRYDEAEKLFVPMLSDTSTPPGVWELLGRVYLNQDRFARAAEMFRRVIKAQPDNSFAWLFLGFAYSDGGQKDSALAVFERGVKQFPRDADMWAYYGVVLQQTQHRQEAVAAFKKALENNPNNRTALINLPLLYDDLKQYALSDSMFEHALKVLGDDPLLMNNYAYSLAERNEKLELALKLATKAVEADSEQASYLDTIGWVYFKLGRLAEAEKWIKKAVQKETKSDVVVQHLGDVYEKMGKMDLARRWWQKALEMNPENKEAREKLNRHSPR